MSMQIMEPKASLPRMLILAASDTDARDFLGDRREDVPDDLWPPDRRYEATIATWNGGGLAGNGFDAVIVTRFAADVAVPVAQARVRDGGWIWVEPEPV